MNHRRRKIIRFVKLLWIIKKSRKALIFYLINTLLSKSRFLARISSKIITIIHVVRYYQINDNWFNESFAVSSYRLLILEHAWLNLWDKHMTIDKINQIIIVVEREQIEASIVELTRRSKSSHERDVIEIVTQLIIVSRREIVVESWAIRLLSLNFSRDDSSQ